MKAFHLTSAPMDEAERNARVHAGEMIVFRGFARVGDLIALLRRHCRAHLGPDPEAVHRHAAGDELDAAVTALRTAVLDDPEVSAALNAALAGIGVDLAATHGDGLKQRVQTVARAGAVPGAAALGVHRDTWGSNVMSQTNWWAPVYPLTPERTIAMFPTWFDRPVPNDSEGWDFRELVRRSRAGGPRGGYPQLPLATEPPPWDDAVPVCIEPGDLLCFSGAHLHASVPNGTERTRLSCEIRTVNAGDVAAERGAPNVDGRPVRTTWQLFRRLTDGRKLGQMA